MTNHLMGWGAFQLKSLFLSYSQKDIKIAEHVAEVATEEGLRPWLDVIDVPLATSWARSIQKALRECEAVLLLASLCSLQSRYVQREIAYAMDHGKRIHVLRLDNVVFPQELQEYEHLLVADLRSDPLSRDLIARCLGSLRHNREGIWCRAHGATPSEPRVPDDISALSRSLKRIQLGTLFFCSTLLLSALPAASALQKKPNFLLLSLGAALGFISVGSLGWMHHRVLARSLGANRASLIHGGALLAPVFVDFLALVGATGGELLSPSFVLERTSALIFGAYVISMAGFLWWNFQTEGRAHLKYLGHWLPRSSCSEIKHLTIKRPTNILMFDRNRFSRVENPEVVAILYHRKELRFVELIERELSGTESLAQAEILPVDIQGPSDFATLDPGSTILIPILSPSMMNALQKRHHDFDSILAPYTLLPILFQLTNDLGSMGRLQWIDARKDYRLAVAFLVKRLETLADPVFAYHIPMKGDVLDFCPWPDDICFMYRMMLIPIVSNTFSIILWTASLHLGWPLVVWCALYSLIVFSFFYLSYWKRAASIRLVRWVSWVFGCALLAIVFDHLMSLTMARINHRMASLVVAAIACQWTGLANLLFSSHGFWNWMGADSEELLIWEPLIDDERWSFVSFGVLTVIFLAVGLLLRGWV